MPAMWLICPDGENIEIKKCLGSGCRMAADLPAGRCLSIRTLRLIADQRPWTGIPSTTQLLKGTREAFLEITTDYAIDPQGALFRVNGTKAHGILDKFTGMGELGEERLSDKISSGMFDFYDDGVLYDTKTWGSFKIQKALGMYSVDVPTGEVYKTDCKSGKKGDPKTRKEWFYGGRKDRLDTAIQLNDYRMKLESLGFPVKAIMVEALVRDGGLMIAAMRGIQQNGVLIPINRISDHWIRAYMKAKAEALHRALETGAVPPKCRNRETWSGRKCDKYCNVAKECVKHLNAEEINRKLVS
ncbi:MAG: hypothetical protein ACYC4H_14895 [Desulfocucumaceae bacterium]